MLLTNLPQIEEEYNVGAAVNVGVEKMRLSHVKSMSCVE